MSASKECIICHYWHFLDKGFKLLKDPAVCDSCLVVLMMTIKLDSVAIFIVCSIDDYPCVIVKISKSEAISLLRNDNLSEKSRSLWKVFYCVLKMNKKNLIFGGIEIEKCKFHNQKIRFWWMMWILIK